MGGIGVFPGTFNPPTVGHVAVADAAVARLQLDRLDLVLSESPLDKHGNGDLLPLGQRVELVRVAMAGRPWARVETTPHQLIADIAEGYDVVVMGADKWAQLGDPRYYGGDPAARDAALAALPAVMVAPRGGWPVPEALRLDVAGWVAEVSATAVRSGRHDWHAAPPPERP